MFEVFDPGEYIYVGEVELAKNSYQEKQTDDNGEKRKVYMFPLKPKTGGDKPQPATEALNRIREKKQKQILSLSFDDIKNRSKLASGKPATRKSTSTNYQRNEDVAAYVKLAANGVCDLCEQEAPFKNKVGQPFLECHHVQQLSKGGEDSNSNAVALCPNCHRKMHSLNHHTDQKKLYRRIKNRDM